MGMTYRSFVIVLGAACACAQTLLDRSGVVVYGGAASTLPQAAIWAALVLTALICLGIVIAAGERRALGVVAALGVALTLVGCLLLFLLRMGVLADAASALNVATLALVSARAPTLQIWVCLLVGDARAVRLIVYMMVLTAAITLVTVSLPSSDMQLAGYVLVSLVAACLVFVPLCGSFNAGAAPGGGCGGLLSAMGVRSLACFCGLQMLPTVISGIMSSLEIYVPLDLAVWRQIASFVSGALLVILLGVLAGPGRVPSVVLPLVPLMIALCVVVPLGTSESFSIKPLFILAIQFGGVFGIFNVHRAVEAHGVSPVRMAFLGQVLLFGGLLVGSSGAAAVFDALDMSALPQGMYTTFALSGLLLLLAGLIFMIMRAQDGWGFLDADDVQPQAGPSSLPAHATAGEGIAADGDDAAASRRALRSSQDAVNAMAVRYGLTTREHDMLSFLARGFSRQRIADDLGLSTSTVKTHVNNLYAKLDVHKRDELLDLVNEFRRA